MISTANSEPQLRALVSFTERELREKFQLRPLSQTGESVSGWMVLDFGNVIVHFMTPETRDRYNLEGLWGEKPAEEALHKLCRKPCLTTEQEVFMGDIPRPQDNWNEYRWEQEIRRDERRISCYYRELPACLDLPGEEDMIFSSLLSQPDLVPIGGNADSLRVWHSESEEEDDDEFDAGARRGPARKSSTSWTGLRWSGTYSP